MKKYYLGLTIAFVIAIIIAMIGLINNGFRSVGSNSNEGPFVVWGNPKSRPVKTLRTAAPFQDILVDAGTGNIYIKVGGKYQVRFQSNQKAKLKVKNQQLEVRQTDISEPASIINIIHNGSSKTKRMGNLFITVPDANTLKNIKITNGDGKIDLKNLNLKSLKIDNDDQNINLTKVKVADHAHINSDDSVVNISNSQLKNLYLAADDGKFLVRNSQFSNLDLEAEEIRIKMNNTSLIGNNRVAGDEVKLDLQNVSEPLNYRINEDTEVYYKGKHYDGYHDHNLQGANLLYVNCDDSTVMIN